MKKSYLTRAGVIGATLLAFTVAGGRAELIYGLSQNTLFTFDSATPGTIGGMRAVTGLGGDNLVGIDVRPETGTLYGLGSSLRLFSIDPATGVASATGSSFGTSLGNNYGFDFNPVPDAGRVVNDAAQNFRISPRGSLLGNDGTLAYAVGDPNFGQDPRIVAVAYANNNRDATTTSLFGIDSSTDTLVPIPTPNSGVLNTRGLLGVNTTEKASFDISGLSGTAYASLTKPGDTVSGFYQIDLDRGSASFIGNIGFSGPLDGLTAVAVPEPGTGALLMIGLGALMARRHARCRGTRAR